MKRKSLYILTALAVLPMASALIISGIDNNKKYYLADESGSRSVMGNVKFETYQNMDLKYNKKVTVDAGNVKAENYSDIYMYGDHKSIKDNKSFFRHKLEGNYTISENDKYACCAVDVLSNKRDYIDFYMKNLKSGKEFNKEVEVKLDKGINYSIYDITISEKYAIVWVNYHKENSNTSDDDIEAGYKFDLETGNFVSKFELGKKIITLESNQSDRIYYTVYDPVEIEKAKSENTGKGIDKDFGSKEFYVYNTLNDTVEKVKMNSVLDIQEVIEYKGSLYLFDNYGDMIVRTEDGKFKEKVELIKQVEGKLNYLDDFKIQDDKIYAVNSVRIKNGDIKKTALKVFDANSGKELYSGSLLKKGLLEKNAEPIEIQYGRGSFIS